MAKYGLSLDPITGQISLPSQVQPLEKTESNKQWQVEVTESVRMLPFTGTKVKCRLVDESFKLKEPRQFLAEIDGLCSAVNSSEAGCFGTFIPNASEEDICLERGNIIDSAYPMTEFNFITNSSMVNSVMATNQAPRKHSTTEICHIRDVLLDYLSSSELPKVHLSLIHI